MRRKKTIEMPEDIIFCTACGKTLTDFYKSKDANDVQKIEEHHKNCRETGKFQGEVCAKLFIALDFDLEDSKEYDEI